MERDETERLKKFRSNYGFHVSSSILPKNRQITVSANTHALTEIGKIRILV